MDVLLWFSMCFICRHLPAAESVGEKILFASTHSIMELDVDKQHVIVLVGHGGRAVYSMDYDYENRYVYFPRHHFNDIVRFPYPSQNITLQHVVNTESSPSGVAVDPANDHVYWVNDISSYLYRCRTDGTNLTVFNGLSGTFVIRLDVKNSWMYISYFSTGISRSRFDLTNFSMIADFTASVVSMNIDLTEQRLYWINYAGDIKSVNVDGSDVRTIISTNSPSFHYISLGVLGSNIYYNDIRHLVMRNKSQGSTVTVLYTDTSRINSIYVFDSKVCGK